MTYFVVIRRTGPDWDPRLPMEKQSGWRPHARFMDGLVRSGFVVLGGPLEDELRVLLIVDAASAEALRAKLAEDPWHETHLVVDSVERWTIRLDGRTQS